MDNGLELIEKYAIEVDEDTKIDATNILDKQYSAPNMKHKWLFRLTKAKITLAKLAEEKETIFNHEFLHNNPTSLSKSIIKSKVDSSAKVAAINKNIIEYQLLVDYLERSVKDIFSQIGFDFKNLVELIKMEQL
jgi:Recombination, repair and ssDNA binding protein UvsY